MDLLQLRKEIDYIFETGANGTRIFELFKMFLQRQWQPMDTAPKDGTEILITDIENGVPIVVLGAWLNDRNRWVVEIYDSFDMPCASVENPIGWQPLPKPMKP